ncbi:hypothetical protein PHYSODRAFT_301197 [Phytophthora sojae]|uniref:Uncharacterized protein n=1 Tax=Phytophthora sojae (strain P6497) TaxID=1094619 RepID=G4ZGZ1_PHYSP|nr:hypothetical protein PHYSODRAFT_301197 [Phytophthora sojae]EGZ18616.1 hypothetical protein PHYSODRAFT_301197 [Phytophthora sojae]|eukprot:XP_009527674.1 hypothetical protein PHYSODRAFT_301197 [Phytophthora sojae]
MIAAARNGYIEAVRVLMLEIISAQTGKLDYASRQVLTKAASAAGSNGHLVVVELLLLEIEADDEREDEREEESDYDSGDDELAPSHKAAWEIPEEASAHGHL